jgi:hypothetical protein
MLFALVGIALAGCQTKHTIAVEPIRVEPIYLTVDVNVRLDRELEEAFGYQDRIESEMSATSPATSASEAPSTTSGGVQ